jgi:hypothetical protein
MEQPFTLDDVVTNSELNCRKSRDPDYQAEAEALGVGADDGNISGNPFAKIDGTSPATLPRWHRRSQFA